MDGCRIAHITDLHITPEGELNKDVDVRRNFIRILEDVKKDDTIDRLVIGGDLGHKLPGREVLEWVKAQLDATGLPYRVIPGNHDDSQQMAEVFGLEEEMEGGKLFFWDELDFGKIFYLDTSTGDLPMHQLAWVEEECGKSYQKFLLFMHHPPVQAGVPHMDRTHALVNMSQVQRILRNINNIQGIFCGHYHVERTVRLYNHMVLITPSTFFQLDDTALEMKVGSYRIGWRKITWDGTHLSTYVKYLDTDK